MRYTNSDMVRAFNHWKNLDRTKLLGPTHQDEIEKAWRYYTMVRDYILENYNKEFLEKTDLQIFDEGPST